VTTADGHTARSATVRWLTEPPRGVAHLRVGSDAVTALPLSAPAADPTHGETTPGELLAAASAAFIATHLAQRLQRNDMPAQELVVRVHCELSGDGATRWVVGYDFQLHGRFPGLDEEGFRKVARAALTSSLGSLGICGDIPVKLAATLIP
jgi:organic hydroperoxide reductase OsmC/OhrA